MRLRVRELKEALDVFERNAALGQVFVEPYEGDMALKVQSLHPRDMSHPDIHTLEAAGWIYDFDEQLWVWI